MKVGANPNVEKYPLIEAVRGTKTEVTNILLQIPGIDLNVANHDGRTPLHYAARNDQDLVKKLLQMGADATRLT